MTLSRFVGIIAKDGTYSIGAIATEDEYILTLNDARLLNDKWLGTPMKIWKDGVTIIRMWTNE